MANKKDLKKFNVEMITQLGGCKEAMKYLRKKYGSEVVDLSDRKGYIINLLDEGREDWVINFCLNVMDIKKRATFLEFILIDLYLEFPSDKDLKKISNLIIKQVIHGKNNKADLAAYNVMYKNKISQLESIDNPEEKESILLKRLVRIKKMKTMQTICGNMNKNFIKACRMSSIHACEAIITRDVMKGSGDIIELMRRNKMKEYGLYAMMLTDIWPNE